MVKTKKSVENITHGGDTRTNIPTAEYESLMRDEDKKPIKLKYPRNSDLDPQLVWRGKDDKDWSDLVVTAPPLYIQEKINPKHIIDELLRCSKKRVDDAMQEYTPDMFDNLFDGQLDSKARTEFYAHDQNWSNRVILGDSLQVMASLAEREGLRGKVQCIYFDPPYGIKFGSNWQVSMQSRDVKDGKTDQISREPEMVKAFRDTWSDGIHSYMSYLRDRLTVARDLLHESGSIFVQIGDENVHRVRALLDEVFGPSNVISQITVQKTGSQASNTIGNVADYILWFAKDSINLKNRNIFLSKKKNETGFTADPLTSDGASPAGTVNFSFQGQVFHPGKNAHWKTHEKGMATLAKAGRIIKQRTQIRLKKYWTDNPVKSLTNIWSDTGGATNVIYVVQSSEKLVQRCICMSSDPGDLILDPTCGSGTTAVVAEKMERRWITIDTSRVALSLARNRLISTKFDHYLLLDSPDGQLKKNNLIVNSLSKENFAYNVRAGFVYKSASHITLGAIANNQEIDVIWDNYRKKLESLHQQLNLTLNQQWQEWEIPHEVGIGWSEVVKNTHSEWLKTLNARQIAINDSIKRNAEIEYLYDQPYVDKLKIRVTGPFTVESLSPHKVISVDEDQCVGRTDDANCDVPIKTIHETDFSYVILEHLRSCGVQQAHKEDRIKFTSINAFPGILISGDARYNESDSDKDVQKRAAIFIGPEYGTLIRADIEAAAKEARDLNFDVLICCAFNYDAYSSEIRKLGDLPILKARMNPDLHMADDLKNTGAGNMFVVFGEPDIELIYKDDDKIQVKIKGVDVFHPSKGEVVSGGSESIAAWFIDTDYNEESFFVRHTYFLGADDPYKQLKRCLKAEIDGEAWESLYRDISRTFPKPETGRIAVKVINHLGDEVMKVFNVV